MNGSQTAPTLTRATPTCCLAVGLVALVVIVIVISVAVGIPDSWLVVGGKSSASDAKESEARRTLVSEAVTASNAAIDDKALANKILLDKTRAEKSAAANAAADHGASQEVADNAKTELVNAEASASKADIKALAAMAAARDTIQRAQAEPQFGWVGWTLLSLLLGGLFPLSAWAFWRLEVPALVAQAEHDCDLLGSPSLEATSSTANEYRGPGPIRASLEPVQLPDSLQSGSLRHDFGGGTVLSPAGCVAGRQHAASDAVWVPGRLRLLYEPGLSSLHHAGPATTCIHVLRRRPDCRYGL